MTVGEKEKFNIIMFLKDFSPSADGSKLLHHCCFSGQNEHPNITLQQLSFRPQGGIFNVLLYSLLHNSVIGIRQLAERNPKKH